MALTGSEVAGRAVAAKAGSLLKKAQTPVLVGLVWWVIGCWGQSLTSILEIKQMNIK